MTKERKVAVGRREFLQTVGVGLVTVAAGRSLAGAAQADSESGDEKRKARYRETEHVKAFYRVNRYPSRRGRPC